MTKSISGPDFSHNSALDVSSARTSEMTLYHLAGEPVLTGRIAGEANKPYFNQLLRRSARARKVSRATGQISAAQVTENRNEDRELFPKCVLTKWQGVVDSNGAAVEFTIENCAAFLESLPDWVFDDVREHFATTSNFLDPDALGMDVEEVTKN